MLAMERLFSMDWTCLGSDRNACVRSCSLRLTTSKGVIGRRDGHAIDDEHDWMVVPGRVATWQRLDNRGFVEAGERSILDELDVGEEALVRWANDLILEIAPQSIVGEVRAHDRSTPGHR
jgi:hypothetical protein